MATINLGSSSDVRPPPLEPTPHWRAPRHPCSSKRAHPFFAPQLQEEETEYDLNYRSPSPD
eukprot:6963859-Prymnesium_polylepis.1